MAGNESDQGGKKPLHEGVEPLRKGITPEEKGLTPAPASAPAAKPPQGGSVTLPPPTKVDKQ
jgi:hypothetical protein